MAGKDKQIVTMKSIDSNGNKFRAIRWKNNDQPQSAISTIENKSDTLHILCTASAILINSLFLVKSIYTIGKAIVQPTKDLFSRIPNTIEIRID